MSQSILIRGAYLCDPAADVDAPRALLVLQREPLYVVGGGVLLGLVLRLRMPWLFENSLFSRRRQRHADAGPMTVQLKPRSERYG